MRMLSRSRSSPHRRNRAAIASTMSPRTRTVHNAAAGDRQAEIKLAVALSVPAEMVGHREVWHRPAWLERPSQIFRQALAGPFLTALGDDVFETRMAAIAAIAPVAVQ